MTDVFIGTVKKILNKVRGSTLTEIQRRTGIAYCHVHTLVKRLEGMGLLYTERVDRRRICKITPRGEQLRNTLNELWRD